MTIGACLFWLICALTVFGAAWCVFARNLFRAALGLGLCLAGVAGLYLFLQAEYLAAIQLVVYVGGVLVLTVFGVMFSRDILGETQRPPPFRWILGLGIAIAAFSALGRAVERIVLTAPGLNQTRTSPDALLTAHPAPAVQGLGDLLAGTYAGAVALAAVLLVLVLVGALALVRKDDPQDPATATAAKGQA